MKMERFKITVCGSGVFPIDMLRYDSCWPATEQDSSKIVENYYEGDKCKLRSVDLLTDNHRHWKPTDGRWQSFTWKVEKFERVV